METAVQTYDVFLSHSFRDRAIATEVADRLRAEGLVPFYDATIEASDAIGDAIWEALAECHAFVVVVSPDASPDAMGMVELGAATAWNKPIFLLLNGPASMKVPLALQRYRAYPLSRIDEVAGQILQSLEPFSNEDRECLIEAYKTLGVSVDELSQSPQLLKQIVNQFNSNAARSLSGDRILSELLRMRKQSVLPRIGRHHRRRRA